MNPAQPIRRPFIPRCGFAHLDGLGFWDFEWSPSPQRKPEVTKPFKLPRGWLNRQRKRAARIASEIAALDRRILAADIERATCIGREIQLDLEIEVEKDRRLQEWNRQRADLQADAENTAKYVAQVTATMGRAVNKEKRKLQRDIDKFNAQIRAGLKRRFRPDPLHFSGAL